MHDCRKRLIKVKARRSICHWLCVLIRFCWPHFVFVALGNSAHQNAAGAFASAASQSLSNGKVSINKECRADQRIRTWVVALHWKLTSLRLEKNLNLIFRFFFLYTLFGMSVIFFTFDKLGSFLLLMLLFKVMYRNKKILIVWSNFAMLFLVKYKERFILKTY